jgi:zinc transporter 1
MEKARTVSECLHAYGIHSTTLQPELAVTVADASAPQADGDASSSSNNVGTAAESASLSLRRRRLDPAACQVICGSLCDNLKCCTNGQL